MSEDEDKAREEEEQEADSEESDKSDGDEHDTSAADAQSQAQRRRARTAYKPPSPLEIRLDNENPLPAAPFQPPTNYTGRRWTKAELLVIVYERRLGRFANGKPDGDFSWGRWISYVRYRPFLSSIPQSLCLHTLVIPLPFSSVLTSTFCL